MDYSCDPFEWAFSLTIESKECQQKAVKGNASTDDVCKAWHPSDVARPTLLTNQLESIDRHSSRISRFGALVVASRRATYPVRMRRFPLICRYFYIGYISIRSLSLSTTCLLTLPNYSLISSNTFSQKCRIATHKSTWRSLPLHTLTFISRLSRPLMGVCIFSLTKYILKNKTKQNETKQKTKQKTKTKLGPRHGLP